MTQPRADNPPLLADRVAIVTGANTGIGLETAAGLRRLGARVIGTSRNAERGAAALHNLTERTDAAPDAPAPEMWPLDLADLANVKRFAQRATTELPHVDILINNAGAILDRRQETAQGFEMTWGVNHLAPFYLTRQLLGRLTDSPHPPARVINVASGVHHLAVRGLNYAKLARTGRYSSMVVYADSKLANVLFALELSRRYRADKLVAHAVHPGGVASDFGQDGDLDNLMGRLMKRFGDRVLLSPEQGAATSIFVAAAEVAGQSTGTYWVRRKPGIMSLAARRREAGRALWEQSERMLRDVGYPVDDPA